MKKLTILTSVLALTACGGGSGGSGSAGITNNPSNPGTPNAPMTFGNVELPTSRVSSAAADSNSAVTGMDSSVTNIAEMTETVKTAIGVEDLDYLANNLDNISSSTSNLTVRSASARRSTLRSLSGFNDRAEAANYTITFTDDAMKEMAHKTYDEIMRFLEELSAFTRNIWFKMLCYANGSCNSYSLEELATMIHEQATHNHWHDFYERNHYREYTLKDVDFTMSSASNGDEAGALDIVRFDLDENSKIIGVKFISLDSDEIGHEDTQNTGDDTYITRNGNKNEFNFYSNGEDKLDDGTVIRTRLEGTTTVETYGHETGNRYSDFGRFIATQDKYYEGIEEPKHKESYEPFAGGYTDKIVIPSESMEFTGKAVGTIQGKDEFRDDLRVDGTATLAFNGANQNQTLSMNFDNWYNVTIDKNMNNDQLTFTFSGTTADNNYALTNMGTGAKEVIIANPGNYNGTGYSDTHPNGKLQINYYGDNGNPEEFVGVAQYAESIDNQNFHCNFSFGGVRNNQ